MISGGSLLKHGILRNIKSAIRQARPRGIDLSLQRVLKWTSPATIDFYNPDGQPAATSELSFNGEPETISLTPGAYLVEFNETLRVPLNCSGEIFTNPALWRGGGGLTMGVIEPGYEGVLSALLDVKNPAGLVVHRNARLGQIIFKRLRGKRRPSRQTDPLSPDILKPSDPPTDSQPAEEQTQNSERRGPTTKARPVPPKKKTKTFKKIVKIHN